MNFKTNKKTTSSDERFFCHQLSHDNTPRSALSPALSNLRAAFGKRTDNYCAENENCVSPLTCPAERFGQGQLLKNSVKKSALNANIYCKELVGRELKSNMRCKAREFFKEKFIFASQWQVILEPCIPPTGAQVSVLRRAPH